MEARLHRRPAGKIALTGTRLVDDDLEELANVLPAAAESSSVFVGGLYGQTEEFGRRRSQQTQLTGGPDLNGTPLWSLDGQRIVFVTDRDGNL